MKITILIILACVASLMIGFVFGCLADNKEPSISAQDLISRVEDALGDDYKKQTVSEVIAQLTYAKEDGSTPIYYYFVKTTYYEADPDEMTGLNTDALRTIFDPDKAKHSEVMMIQDWPGCLYIFADKSYLCWTVAPDISYILEYDPSTVLDADILRMAESAVPFSYQNND